VDSVPEIKVKETREGRKKPEKFDWGLGQIFAPKKILKIDFSKNFSLFCIFFFSFFSMCNFNHKIVSFKRIVLILIRTNVT